MVVRDLNLTTVTLVAMRFRPLIKINIIYAAIKHMR